MPVAVTGSIATDHLMTFPGKFTEQFVEGQMENVSLSFLVDDLVQHRGGAGANMAYGLGPARSAAGPRRRGRQRLRRLRGLARPGTASTPHSVHWSELKHTARFVCTTDAANNQIASFYSGAMSEAAQIELGPVADAGRRPRPRRRRAQRPDGDGAAHRGVPRSAATPFAADPSQQLAWADGEMIRDLVDGADLLFTNEYESAPAAAEDRLERRRGARPRRHLGHHPGRRGRPGPAGRRRADLGHRRPGDQAGRADRRRRRAARRLHRRPACGASAWSGRPSSARPSRPPRSRSIGTQEYDLPRESFLARFADAFGADAADEVAPHLPG